MHNRKPSLITKIGSALFGKKSPDQKKDTPDTLRKMLQQNGEFKIEGEMMTFLKGCESKYEQPFTFLNDNILACLDKKILLIFENGKLGTQKADFNIKITRPHFGKDTDEAMILLPLCNERVISIHFWGNAVLWDISNIKNIRILKQVMLPFSDRMQGCKSNAGLRYNDHVSLFEYYATFVAKVFPNGKQVGLLTRFYSKNYFCILNSEGSDLIQKTIDVNYGKPTDFVVLSDKIALTFAGEHVRMLDLEKNTLLHFKDDTFNECKVFLMKTPPSGIYKESDLTHLYLYKNKDREILYQMENKVFKLEEDEKYTLQLLGTFRQPESNPEPDWRGDVVDLASKQHGHDFLKKRRPFFEEARDDDRAKSPYEDDAWGYRPWRTSNHIWRTMENTLFVRTKFPKQEMERYTLKNQVQATPCEIRMYELQECKAPAKQDALQEISQPEIMQAPLKYLSSDKTREVKTQLRSGELVFLDVQENAKILEFYDPVARQITCTKPFSKDAVMYYTQDIGELFVVDNGMGYYFSDLRTPVTKALDEGLQHAAANLPAPLAKLVLSYMFPSLTEDLISQSTKMVNRP